MHLYTDQFSDAHDFSNKKGAEKTLIIASTPRCGSHMLGHSLYQTGCFGFPLEYANPANLREWKRRFEINETDQALREIVKRRTSDNGVFGIKLHYTHIGAVGGFEQVRALFPEAYYVLLTRNDVLKQAVSLAIAHQTGVWIEGQEPKTDQPPEYRFELIRRCLRETILHNSSWRYTLAAYGCRYIDLDFNDVRQDLPGSVGRIAGFMGVELDPESICQEHATSRQGSGLNKEWAARFIEDFQKQGDKLLPDEPGFADKVIRRLKNILSSR